MISYLLDTSPPDPDLRIEPGRRGPALRINTIRGLESNRVSIRIPSLPAALDGLKILHVSDLHARSRWDPGYDDLIGLLDAARPDLLLFTGDFIESKRDHRIALPVLNRLLPHFKARLGVYAILGNHDGDLMAAPVKSWGIEMLNGRQISLASGDATIELIGLPGVMRDDFDERPLRLLAPKSAQTLRIIMGHYPDQLLATDFLKPDLFLTGHTHGGQICLPRGRPIIRHDSLPRYMCTGIHHFHDTWLISNRGLGYSGRIVVRLFCPPEIIEITLTTLQNDPK